MLCCMTALGVLKGLDLSTPVFVELVMFWISVELLISISAFFLSVSALALIEFSGVQGVCFHFSALHSVSQLHCSTFCFGFGGLICFWLSCNFCFGICWVWVQWSFLSFFLSFSSILFSAYVGVAAWATSLISFGDSSLLLFHASLSFFLGFWILLTWFWCDFYRLAIIQHKWSFVAFNIEVSLMLHIIQLCCILSFPMFFSLAFGNESLFYWQLLCFFFAFVEPAQ